MRDVAALADVGIKTVSRVMNGVPTVDAELAERVRTAAVKLGYRPNLAASNLRRAGGRTGTVGLLVEDVGNPFSAAVARAVEHVARARDVFLLTASLNEDVEREQHLVRTLVDRRADGLIIAPGGEDYRWLVAEQEAGTKLVFVDRVPHPLIADAVVSDNRAGSAAAVQHLLAAGHRRIAFLGDRLGIQTASGRYQGYRDALAVHGIELDPALVRMGLGTIAAGERAAEEVRRDAGATAIFAGQNLILLGAVRALHRSGLQHEVALVGFDDLALADVVRPAITVIAQDAPTLGRLAAERLFARLDGDLAQPAVFEVPTTLLPRGSGEIGPPTER